MYGITRGIGAGTTAANAYQAALLGLTSVANYFSQDAEKAKVAAQQLAEDGLMTVTESANGLKNLLASGFSLPEAIQLMDRFKDSAAFNRQAALGFGQAIVGATEGIKNGNSILVDNAGVTKNLSKILEEAGYSAQDLSNATSDANIRQALFNGLLKETNPMVGDAAKLTKQYAGDQARAAAETTNTARKFGTALQPALSAITRAITPLIKSVGDWIEQNPKLTATITIASLAILGTLAGLAAFGAGVSLVSTGVTALIGTFKALTAVLALLNVNPLMLAFTALTAVVFAVGGAMSLFANSSDRAKATSERLKAAQDNLATSTQNLKLAEQSLTDARLAREGADIAVQRAEQRLAELRSSGTATALDIKEAEYNLAVARETAKKAAQDEAAATADVTAKQKENEKAAKQLKSTMQNLGNSASYTGTQYKSLSDRVNTATEAIKTFNMQKAVDATFSVPVPGSSGAGMTIPQGRSIGTNFAPGGATLVGEHGPELVNLPAGSRVDPAWRTRSEGASEGSGGVTNILSGNFKFTTRESVEAFFTRIDKTQRLAKWGMAA